MPKYFVQNCSSLVGKALAETFKAQDKEQRAEGEGEEGEAVEKLEVLGSLKDGESKPIQVDRIVGSDAASLRSAFEQCDICVLDGLNAYEESKDFLAVVSQFEKALEGTKTLILISSVMTWTHTTPNEEIEGEPGAPLNESDFKKRRPHSNFKELINLEKMLTKLKMEGLTSRVVAAGITYGNGEDVLFPLFKKAWMNEPLPLLTLSDGSNNLPTIHVQDLAEFVIALSTSESEQKYFLAVDDGQLQETKQTLAAVTQKIAEELGAGTVEPMLKEEVLLVRDFQFFQVGVLVEMGEAGKGVYELQHSKEGLLANLPKVIQEFRERNRILPLRTLMHGNDELAVHDMAVKLAAEYKVPHVRASDAVAAAREGESELATELKKYELDATPPALVAQVLSAALTTSSCRNQGYFLEGFPATKEQAALLFPEKPPEAEEGEGEESAEPAEEEGEEGSGQKKAVLVAPPEFVFVVEAADEDIKAKMLAMPDLKITEEAAMQKLVAYAGDNAVDSPTSILALPSLAYVEAINLTLKANDIEPLLKEACMAMQKPRNFGPSAEELAAAKAIADAEAAEAKAKEQAEAAEREEREREERERREALEARRLAELQQQERELLEVRSIPLRTYLMQHVIPTLTEGLIEVCKQRPEDPVDYLAEWLFKNNPVEDDHFH